MGADTVAIVLPIHTSWRAREVTPNPQPRPLPSEEGTTQNVFRIFTFTTRPESGFDCLMSAIFARRRIAFVAPAHPQDEEAIVLPIHTSWLAREVIQNLM